MNASQNKYVWGEINKIAPKMHMSIEDYKKMLGFEVLKNQNGSIKCSSTAAFLALTVSEWQIIGCRFFL